jgi:hypothetical protein
MERTPHLGRIVCIYRYYTVTEVIEDAGDGVKLAGFSVFGRGASRVVYATPEEAMQAVDDLLERDPD